MTDIEISGTRSEVALALIDSWDPVEPGGLVSHQIVVDRLLDLRNAVDGTERSVIDALLRSIPGVNVVESGWWSAQVAELRLLLFDG